MSGRLWRRLRWFPQSVARLMTPGVDEDYKPTRDPSHSDEDAEVFSGNPLLGNGFDQADEQVPGKRDDVRPKRRGRGRRQWYILFLAASMMILAEFAEYLAGAPEQQIFLEIACRNHYARSGDGGWQDTTGEKCRVEPVQTELSLLDGWKSTFDQLPGIFLSIPYGILADRIGRKPVLMLAQFGILLSDIFVRLCCWWSEIVPLRLLWGASFWRIVGGGNQVMAAMIFVLLADTHDEEDRADSFFKLLAAIFVAEIVATPLSAGLMTRNPWIPYVISPMIYAMGILVNLIFLPETLKDSIQKAREAEASRDSPIEMRSPQDASLSRREDVSTSTRAKIAFLMSRRNVMYLLFCFFTATIGRKGMLLLLQFVYKKFGWTMAQASFLISLRGFMNLINDLLILPALSHVLMSPRFPFQWSAPVKDIALSKLAAIYLIVSNLMLAVSSNITMVVLAVILFAMGSSFFLTARSLVTSLVPPDRVGVLYTAIGMVSGVGVLIAGPSLAFSFSIGMKMGEGWLGLPYAVAASLFGLVAIAVWNVKLTS